MARKAVEERGVLPPGVQKRIGTNGKVSYRVRLRLQGQPLLTKTFDRLTDARAWIEDTKSGVRFGRVFPEHKANKHTVGDLVDRYIRDVCPEKKDGTKQARQLEWWKDRHGFRLLGELSPEVLGEARDELAGEVGPTGKRRSGATVNRYLAAMSHALTMASREWGWARENPMLRVTKRKESRGRVRWLVEAEIERLLAACRASGLAYLEPAVVLALCTGMRQGEILGLRWRFVDLKRARVVLDDTKNGERRGVAVVGPALEALRKLAKVRRLDDDRVLPDTGSFRRAFGNAVKRAKLDDFRFHDLRHTAASYLAMNGATPNEIAAVLGHKTLAMVKRYAHLHDDHVAGVVGRMVTARLEKVLG